MKNIYVFIYSIIFITANPVFVFADSMSLSAQGFGEGIAFVLKIKSPIRTIGKLCVDSNNGQDCKKYANLPYNDSISNVLPVDEHLYMFILTEWIGAHPSTSSLWSGESSEVATKIDDCSFNTILKEEGPLLTTTSNCQYVSRDFSPFHNGASMSKEKKQH